MRFGLSQRRVSFFNRFLVFGSRLDLEGQYALRHVGEALVVAGLASCDSLTWTKQNYVDGIAVAALFGGVGLATVWANGYGRRGGARDRALLDALSHGL